MPKRSQPRKWKIAENLVALLEKVIAPNAKVRSNVFLPVIGSNGERRQCDVVIREGPPSREKLTLVEVQKRKRKPTVGDFDGWFRKMEKLGANSLICVSHQGFSASVVDEVQRTAAGRRVHLLTLLEMSESDPDWPSLKFSDSCHFSDIAFKIVRLAVPKLVEPAQIEVGPFTITDPLFAVGKIDAELVSLENVLHKALKAHGRQRQFPEAHEEELRLTIECEVPTWLQFPGDIPRQLVSWEVCLNLTYSLRNLRVTYSKYKYCQLGEAEPMAWVVEGFADDGENVHVFSMAFKQDGLGFKAASPIDSPWRVKLPD